MTNNTQKIADEIKQKTNEVIELIDNAKSEQASSAQRDPQKVGEFKRLTALAVTTFKLASEWAVKSFKIYNGS